MMNRLHLFLLLGINVFFILLSLSKSSFVVDSQQHHVTNITAINNDETTLTTKNLMIHSKSPKGAGLEPGDTTTDQQQTLTAYQNYLLNNIEHVNRAIMASRRFGYHSLLTTFIYTLTFIPLLFALTRSFNPAIWPYGGGFYYAGSRRYKRSTSSTLANELHSYTRLPLMNRHDTTRFLSLFETTLLDRKILDENCKKYYSCKVFQNAIKSRDDSLPKLSDFEWALLEILGVVVERYDFKLDLVHAVKMYYEIATNALKGVSCAQLYPCYNIKKSNNQQHKKPKQPSNMMMMSRTITTSYTSS